MAADVDDANVRVPRDMIERIIIVLFALLVGDLTLSWIKLSVNSIYK